MKNASPAAKISASNIVARRVALAVGWTAAVFSFSVALLMGAAWMQARRQDPLSTALLDRMRARLAANPQDDALRRDLREADLLLRRQFFATQRQLRLGAGLAIGGAIVLLLAFQAAAALRIERPDPGRHTEDSEREWAETRAARRTLSALGAVALLVLGGAALLAPRPPPELAAAATAGARPPPAARAAPAPPRPAAAPAERADPAAAARRWPGFRGPDGLGVAAAAAASAPPTWNGAAGENIRWKARVPRRGFSSPAVWDDAVFVTGADREAREVFCYDAHSGALRWRAVVPTDAAAIPEVTADTGYAAPTPATDGERVYAVFATGDVVALDFEGREVWRRHLGVPQNAYGHASSPIVRDGVLFVQFDHAAEAALIAMDAATGATRWEAEGDAISWASPALIEIAGRPMLVRLSSESVSAYDPASGRRLWREACMSGEVGASPAFDGGIVFVANEYAVGAALRVRPDGTGVEKLWETHDRLPEVASPVAHGGRVYFAAGDGAVTCLGAADGAERWVREFDRGFYASPIVVGDRVYALDRDGVMRIFADADEYRELGRAPLGEPAVATPAVAHGRLYLRGYDYLYAVESGAAPERPEPGTE